MPQSFFFNTDHQLEAVNATPLYPKPLITALADMKIILFSKTFLSMNFRMVQIPTGPQQISIFRTYFRLCTHCVFTNLEIPLENVFLSVTFLWQGVIVLKQ